MARKFEGDLSLSQRITLRWRGRVYVGDQTREGWSGSLPFYVFRCREHGLIEDYLHGLYENLSCEFCEEEADARRSGQRSFPAL